MEPHFGASPVLIGGAESVSSTQQQLQVSGHAATGRSRGKSHDSGIMMVEDHPRTPAAENGHHHWRVTVMDELLGRFKLKHPSTVPILPPATAPSPTSITVPASIVLDGHPLTESCCRGWVPSSTTQHRQSMSVDSGVVMEMDSMSAYEVLCNSSVKDMPLSPHPYTPRASFRLSGYMFSPQLPASPTSRPSSPIPPSGPPSPSEESEDSQEWDHICIGQDGDHNTAEDLAEEVRVEMEAVTLERTSSLPAYISPTQPIQHYFQPVSNLETIRETEDASEVVLDADTDTDTEAVSTEEADQILAFSLPTVRGINSTDVPQEVLEVCRSVTYAYAERIAALIDGFQDLSVATTDEGSARTCTNSGNSRNNTQRQSSSSTSPQDTTGKGNGKGRGKPNRNKKRRLDDTRDNEDDEEDDSGDVVGGGDPGDNSEDLNTGGAKLRCIFRARNPSRFNVRDHTSCAMTMFTKFSDLRKHVLNKHTASSETATCPRCKQGFPSRHALEKHSEAEIPCASKRADPEDGINSETAARIRFRGRDCGPSDEEQWKHLWQLAFPGDLEHQVKSYQFIPVLEHHELEPTFHQALSCLKPVVQSLVPDTESFEALCATITALFASAVNELTNIGLKMDYVNRQGSRTSTTSKPRSSVVAPRVLWDNSFAASATSRDSGIGLDSDAGTPRTSARFSAPRLSSFSVDADGGNRFSAGMGMRNRASFTPPQNISIAPASLPTRAATMRYPSSSNSFAQRLQTVEQVPPTMLIGQHQQQTGNFDAPVEIYHGTQLGRDSNAGGGNGMNMHTNGYMTNTPNNMAFHSSMSPETEQTLQHINPSQLDINYQQHFPAGQVMMMQSDAGRQQQSVDASGQWI
ncbi:hypothetical protein QBC35DRAFT_535157 [Podospora australis]|uniref:C2H2-type domain-containing protein n=1 Tax=Podospora australis TaxID=1536484 RepID=A0AAN6WPW9_9PEZI|nr:hypothetical protein QBC35DRAFT_535157 [Podospora australis]